MNLKQAKERRAFLVARTLEIEAELAEMKRAWHAGEEKPGAQLVRTTLEAERAALSVEKNALHGKINAAKKAEKEFMELTMHATLVRLLHERGLSDLVVEAKRMAVDQRICVA
jgi:hypothetical protein